MLNVISSPWPFSMWGIDMIGRIEPKASNGHRFILVAIDYFTKWVVAASYANVTKQVVVRFVKNNIISRYGVPSKIITDNGTNLNNNMMKELCSEFKIEHHNSSPYRPQMNGAVEAANKNIKKIMQKMVVISKKSLPERAVQTKIRGMKKKVHSRWVENPKRRSREKLGIKKKKKQ